MIEEQKEPSYLFSLLFAFVGAGCIGVSVWLMPWSHTVKAPVSESQSVQVETVDYSASQNARKDDAGGAGETEAKGPGEIETVRPGEPVSDGAGEAAAQPPPAGGETESAGEAEPSKVGASENGASSPSGEESALASGPWTIALSPDNYSITAKGWAAIKEIRALFLANPNAKIDIIGTANIMRSKKRAAHAAQIVRDRISQGDPHLKWRMTISGVLSERELGLTVTAKVVGGEQ